MDGVGSIGVDIEIDITRVDNKYQLHIDTTVMDKPLITIIEVNILRSNDAYTISSAAGTSTLGAITVTSGTITANGDIIFNLEIPELANLPGANTTVTYSGKKLENLAKAVAGTYEGVVTLNNTSISAPDAEITLTAVDRTTVRWTTSTQVTIPDYGAQTLTIEESHNFMLTVSGSSGTYTLTGSGSTMLGNLEITTASKVEGKSISLTMDAGLNIPLIYTGQRQ
jgi:hypothetical protein